MNPLLHEALLSVVRRRREPLWFVGGPVRDSLLGLACQDWDFACRKARPLALQVAQALRAKFIVLDEQNRIYRVVLSDHQTLDFAELQGQSIERDLRRRDFSINAMARLFPDGPLLDPFGGQRDLQRKLIRGVSERAFLEDPLRTLRAFRFAVQLNFKIEARTLQWIRKHREGLDRVSAERIREELLRFWKQPATCQVLKLMDQTGLLSHVFPEMDACRRTAVRYYGTGGVLRHSVETVANLEWILTRNRRPEIAAYVQTLVGGYPRVAWLKWAAFLHDIGKPATAKMIKGRLRFFEHEQVGADLVMKLGHRLRLSRQEVHLLGLWVRHHMRAGSLAAAPRITDKAVSRFFRDLGEDGVGMVLLSLADHYTYLRRSLWGKGRDPVEKMGLRLLDSYFLERSKILPEKLVDGHRLMKALRLKPGPLIGQLLGTIQDAQAEGKVRSVKEALAFAKRKLKR